MRILYGYSNCSDSKYQELFHDQKVAVLQADQKYHGLLIRGLEANGANVECVSGLPVNRSVTRKILIHEKDEQEGNIHYHYLKTFNLPILRQIGIFFGSLFFVWKQKKKQQTAILCDCLNLANAYGMLWGSKIKKFPIIYIVTDLPEFQRSRFLRWVNERMFKRADGFILLTEQMNQKVNLKGKPYIVLEGHCDSKLEELSPDERYENLTGKQIILYAGSLLKLYGIQNLVEGFLAAGLQNAELHIYGDGDYRPELENICRQHQQVHYCGICPNVQIVHEEQRVALLVNPRPSSPEYTKYSFPSKNMEYMVSGTPVLTTDLPGMPREYLPYIYLIRDESPDGIANILRQILSIPSNSRYQKGSEARTFVKQKKSNRVQAKKIIEFLQKEFQKS